jgi:Zn-dependent peptidase ImmA (M78 family)/RNA polymerase subunit RPABC4/transcription elongation factor Spt4
LNTQKRKKIPPRPRKFRSIQIAREFIYKNKINWLPVDPFAIYEKNNWILLSWNEARKILKENDPLKLKKSGAEARTSIPRGTDTVITVYDDTITPPSRIRWTIAHEIGHVVLGHLYDFDKTAINRGGLLTKEYKVLENEADFFATELLQPFAIIKELKVSSSHEIIHICNVSKKAALNREKDLKWWRLGLANYFNKQIKHNFKTYLSEVAICKKLGKPILKHLARKHFRRVKMTKQKLNYVDVDENNRYLECPLCGNDQLSDHANYCKICGLHLFNSCTNAPKKEQKCGKINPPDARFCEYCGEETHLMRLGLLTTWEELVAEHGEIAAGLQEPITYFENRPNVNQHDNNPFADIPGPIDVSDDDLPF